MKFAAATEDFKATLRCDHFPHFTRGREIRIEGLELYASDRGKHHALGSPASWDASSDDLDEDGEFATAVPSRTDPARW